MKLCGFTFERFVAVGKQLRFLIPCFSCAVQPSLASIADFFHEAQTLVQ